LFAFSFSTSYSQNRQVKSVVLDGSEVGAPNLKKSVTQTDNILPSLTTGTFVVNFTNFGISSFYDLQSNSTTNEIWQDPSNPLNVHAAVMVLPAFGGTRVVQYVYSADGGATWSNFGNIAEVGSGFPSISGLSNGSAIITMHTSDGGTPTRSQGYVDIGAGFGAFNRQDPGANGAAELIWGRIIATANEGDANKYVLASSQNAAPPIVSTNTVTDLTSPGTFTGWQNYGSDNAEQYCLGRGADGRIGNAYITVDGAGNGDGNVAFRESMDGGSTWSTPMIIYTNTFATDSLTAFRGLNCVYLGNTPYVAIEVDNSDPVGGTFTPTAPSYVYLWSPEVNGGVAQAIFGGSAPFINPNLGPNLGVMTPLCRPTLGTTSPASDVLFLAMNVATDQYAADSNTYYAIYFSVSYNRGNTWSTPERVTPETPLKDYRYVSLSKTSAPDVTGNFWEVQALVEMKDYAGVFAPNEPPGPADFTSMRIMVPRVGINEISSTVPSGFALKQNFPNPFNPTTSIRFDIQKSTNVTLEVYSANGQKVQTLINNEFVSPGTKEVTFSGSDLSSGIYFYTLSTGDFKETKKMMLIK
jgi:hypothetical protein